jgi:hypothetical protein
MLLDKPELIQMLYAIRAQVEAQHALITAALSVLVGEPAAEPPVEQDASCRHPPEQRINTSTQGGKQSFFCRACGQEIDLTL